MFNLKKIIVAAVGALTLSSALLTPALVAQAQSLPGIYLALGAGYDSMPDANLKLNNFALTSQWKSGWGVLGALGYKFGNGFRAEVEYSDRLAKVSAFNQTNPWWGSQWDNSLMVNALYDFDIGWGISPFVGGGFGGSHISWGDNFRAKGPTIYDGESTRFAWQGIVGVNYAVTPKIDLALDFRYKGSFGTYSFAGSTTGSIASDFEYLTRSVFLNVRYIFGS